MKKTLKPENIFCLMALPILWFIFSKMTTFFIDYRNIYISGIYSASGMVIAEIFIFIFRKRITDYFIKDTNFKVIGLFFLLSIISAFSLKYVFLRGCKNGGDLVCIIGSAFLFALFLTAVFKGLMYFFSRIKTISFSKKDWCFILGLLVLLNLEMFVYCKFMREIFVWDNAGYYTKVHSLNDIFPSMEYFKNVYNSIFESDYNYVIMMPASLMCKLFGKSRLVFLLSIINFYVYPLFVLIYICGKRYFGLGATKTICIILSLPYIIFAANTGFIDIGGIVPIYLAIILYYFCNREKHSILIGILLAIAVYMRRWYSFFALSFIITIFIHSISRKQIKCFLEILLSFSFVLLFFTQDFVSSKLLADYKYMYSAYSLGIRADFMIFTRYYGVLMSAILCLYVLIKQLNNRKFITNETFILLQVIIMFSLFVSVQTHGQQHLSLYIPAFSVLLMSLMAKINSRFGIVVLVAASSLQTANTFVPRIQPTSIQGIKRPALIPDFSNYPSVDDNADGILKITEYMDKEIGEKGKTVCFLSSSIKLNYDTLNNAEISLSVKRKSKIDRSQYYYAISDVDKRDGLSSSLFITDYILVPSQLQTHLAEGEQRVISVPYEEITTCQGIGTAYEKENVSFALADGTEIYLYRRLREIDNAEIDALYNRIFSPVPQS